MQAAAPVAASVHPTRAAPAPWPPAWRQLHLPLPAVPAPRVHPAAHTPPAGRRHGEQRLIKPWQRAQDTCSHAGRQRSADQHASKAHALPPARPPLPDPWLTHLEPLQPILLPLHRPFTRRQLIQPSRRLCLPPLQLLLRRLHLLHECRLARLELALALRHPTQARLHRCQLFVGLGACRQQRLLLLSQHTLLACRGGRAGKAVELHSQQLTEGSTSMVCPHCDPVTPCSNTPLPSCTCAVVPTGRTSPPTLPM